MEEEKEGNLSSLALSFLFLRKVCRDFDSLDESDSESRCYFFFLQILGLCSDELCPFPPIGQCLGSLLLLFFRCFCLIFCGFSVFCCIG